MIVAKILSTFYGLVVTSVTINSAVSLATATDMNFSLCNVLFIFLAGCVFLVGCLYPSEIHYLLTGPIFLLLAPSMNMLLAFYSIINMNAVSWGTRESSSQKTELNPADNSAKALVKK